MNPELNAISCKQLAQVAKRIAIRGSEKLSSLKAVYSQLQRPDFLWHFLLQSFATMGRAAGWHGLIGDRQNYDALKFEMLAGLSGAERAVHVTNVCRRAKIRMPDMKAGYICGCFEMVRSMGGPEAARNRLLALSGRDAKIDFLKQFPGIGDKYARNIMMDVYHEDFRDSIAIDARIQSISAAYGLSFSSYDEQERFWLDVAKEANLEGWELDRLLFNFQKDFLPVEHAMPGEAGLGAVRPARRSAAKSIVKVASKADGYVQAKIKFCSTFPFSGLGALGMWYGEVVEAEIAKWQADVRSAVMEDAADKVAFCVRSDGYQLRRIRTDGRLLQVYDWRTSALVEDSLLPVSLLGDRLRIWDPEGVPEQLEELGGFAAEFAVEGITYKGWLLEGKSYNAAWTQDGRALLFETERAKNPNGRILRRLSS